MSDDLPGAVEGYEVKIARLPNGEIEAVAFMDHEQAEIVEVPPQIAIAFARAILAAIRDPSETLN